MGYLFDGSGDYIGITIPASVATLTTFSYSWWMIKDAFTGAYRDFIWVGGEYTANLNFLVQHNSGNFLALTVQWSTTKGVWSIAVPDTAWHHYLITYSASAAGNVPIWYKDGVAQTVTTQQAAAGSRATSTRNEITIGSHSIFYGPTDEYWLGKLAEYGLWNRVLTAAEAITLGKGFAPSFIPNGLVFYDPLIKNTGDVKNGNVGTVTNAIVYPHPRIIYPTAGL